VARSLLTVRVARRERVTWAIPARLSTFEPRWSEPVEGPVRRITLDFRRMQWLLAGRAFEMTAAAPDETVAAGSRQVWEIANIGGMMGSPMAHPIHVHGLQFRILSRTGGPPTATAAAIREGIIDAGWRDTVLVLPDETVRIQLQFTRHPGLYLYHCHILEHEDGGMMRNFRVS
jgi:FtsP/CotA-like multicopper oxidase with cupredoxin domain